VQQYRCNDVAMTLQTEEKISPAMVQSWLILMVEIMSSFKK
jgi:hypothetical protein